MNAPYPLFHYLWPAALLLILTCTPHRARTWILTRLRILGVAVALLLLIPYLLS